MLGGVDDVSTMDDVSSFLFFFQAEDGIRDLVRSRGLGDVYKRQPPARPTLVVRDRGHHRAQRRHLADQRQRQGLQDLSLIHI